MKIRDWEKVFFLLFVSLILSANTWADKLLRVSQERERIEKNDQALESTDDVQKKKYQDQLELLRIHEEKQKQVKGRSGRKIKEEFEVKLFRYLELFKYKLGFNVSLASLYEFIEIIENSKKDWKEKARSSGDVQSHSLYLDYVDGSKKKIHIDCDTEGRLFLDFKWESPLQGGFKYIQKVLNYETLKPASKILPIFMAPNIEIQKEIQRVFESEGEVLKDLKKLPKEKRVGIIKTYSVTPSVVFQKYISPDLFDLIASPPSEERLFSTEIKTEIIKQIAKGMVSLHQKKIVHNDVKPENVLIDLYRSKGVKAVLIDYGLSLRGGSKEFEVDDRPIEGTPFYLPPETEQRRWFGNTPHERMVSGFKSDVFGLTTVAMLVFNTQGLAVPWKDVCTDLDFQCKSLKISDFQRAIAKQHYYTSLSQLFMAGLSHEVSKRVLADQFLYGIEYIQKKAKMIRSYEYIESRSDLVKLYHHWKHFADIPHEEAERRLFSAKNGDYYLVPLEVPNKGTTLVLCFKDRIGMVQTKVIDISPRDKSAIENEIKFLQVIQTLVTD